MNKLRFKDIPCDAEFRFVDSEVYNSEIYYIKVGKRDYMKKHVRPWAEGGAPAQIYSVGSINTLVQQ